MNDEILIGNHKIGKNNSPFIIAEMSANHNGSIEKAKYWDPFSIEINNDMSEKDAVSKVEDLLIESVEYRQVSDVEVGLFLSGGLDSTLI